MATITTSANPHTETMVYNAVTTVSTMITSTMVKVIRRQAEQSTTTSYSQPPKATTTASAPSSWISEPYNSAINFLSSLSTIVYFFVVTVPSAVVLIIAIWTWRKRCREQAAEKLEKRIEKAETRAFRVLLVQEATLTRECLGRVETRINGMDEGGKEAMVKAVEAMKETIVQAMKKGRKRGMKKGVRKGRREGMREGFETIHVKLDGFLDLIPEAENKKKNRLHNQALLPDFTGKDNAPAWGSTTTTEIGSLLDSGDLVEEKEDEDYEADKEESVYGEDDSSSTVSTASTPDTLWEWEQAGGWEQPENLPLLEGSTWDWDAVW